MTAGGARTTAARRGRSLVWLVAGAFLLAAITPSAAGEVFNIGSGKPAALREIAEALVEIAGKGSIEYIPFPDDARRIEIGDYVADTTRIATTCGWKPQTSLREGLERSVRYYERYLERYL